MRPPRAAVLGAVGAALLLALSGCGPAASPPGDGLDFGITLHGIVPTTIDSFQVTVLATGSNRCAAGVDKSQCLSSQLSGLELVKLRDDQGERRSKRFPASGGSAQDVAITVPDGVKYTFWVEALSKDATPKLLGSGCEYRDVNAEQTAPLQIALFGVTPTPTCDPRID